MKETTLGRAASSLSACNPHLSKYTGFTKVIVCKNSGRLAAGMSSIKLIILVRSQLLGEVPLIAQFSQEVQNAPAVGVRPGVICEPPRSLQQGGPVRSVHAPTLRHQCPPRRLVPASAGNAIPP